LRAWRIYPHAAAYARAPGFDPLDGAGGREVANRWNDVGHPVIYGSATASLAALEVLAGLDRPSAFGERTVLEIELDDEAEEVSLEMTLRLREDASGLDPEEHTRAFGTAWLKEKRSLALVVPSFVMPLERNVLINPLHPRAASLKIVRSDRIRLDQRIARHGRSDGNP
jgi:RES domain-containing protein